MTVRTIEPAERKIVRRFKRKLFSKFLLFIGAFVAIVLISATTTIVALREVNQNMAALEQKGIEGATLLGQMDYGVSAFRLAEGYRALAPAGTSLTAATAFAEARRRDVNALERQYAALHDDEVAIADLAAFHAAWQRCQAAHDAWVKADTQGRIDQPAYAGSELDTGGGGGMARASGATSRTRGPVAWWLRAVPK